MADDDAMSFPRQVVPGRAYLITRRCAKTGLSKRMVAYYEIQGGTPSPAQLGQFAKALGVSADELVGASATRGGDTAEGPQSQTELRLWRRPRQIQDLP